MSLTLHIVRKDFHRLGVPLALWALLVLAQIGIGVRLLNGDGENLEMLGRLELYGYFFFLLDLIVSYVLVASLIHDDPLVGTQVFWRTRPISGARLFGAKLLGAVLMFGVLPLLIWLPWWLSCHYGWADVVRAVIETLAWKTIVVVPALLVAILTDRFSRYLVWTLATVMALVLMLTLVNAVSPLAIDSASVGVAITRAWLAGGAALLGLLAVMGNQFLTRKTRRSFVIVWTMVGLIVLIVAAVPWDLTGRETDSALSSSPVADSISLTLDQAQLHQAKSARRDELVGLFLTMTARGIPEGLGLTAYFGRNNFYETRHVWRWPDGFAERAPGLSGPTFEDWTEWAAPRLLGIPWPQPDSKIHEAMIARLPKLPGNQGVYSSVKVSQSSAARMLREPPAYESRIRLMLIQPEVEFDLPLRESDRRWHGKRSLRIAQAGIRKDQRMFVNLVESEPAPLASLAGLATNAFDPKEYALVKREKREGSFIPRGGARRVVRVGTVQIIWNSLAFVPPLAERDGQWVQQPPVWFEGTTFARVGFTEAGRFSRELKVERFEVKP